MVKGHETEAYGPQFLLYNRKHFIFRVQKTGNGAEWEKNDIIFTEFKEWSITHTWARESSNIYKILNTFTWYDMVQYDTIEYQIERQLLGSYDKIWYMCSIMLWHDMIKYEIASYWYDMTYHIWYDVVYDMMLYDMIWSTITIYDMILIWYCILWYHDMIYHW